MSSITAVPNSPYYQLSDPSAGPGGAGASTPTLSDALLQALSPSPSPSPSLFDSSAYTLNLSPQALAMLNNTGGAGAGSGLLGGSGSFVLTTQQQQQLSTILAKYKNAPYTQDTFNQIQNDLQSAGLAPSQLSLEDQIKSFDPAQVLIDALNGTSTDTTSFGATTGANEQGKSSAYMQQVIQQWQQVSTTYPTSKNAPASGTSAA